MIWNFHVQKISYFGELMVLEFRFRDVQSLPWSHINVVV
jgi:hypothetical protein